MIDQDHYVKDLEGPDMEVVRNIQVDDIMDIHGQREFRSCVGKLLAVAGQSRPDVAFKAKSLSTHFGKATKKHLKEAERQLLKLKGIKTIMFFPDLGEMKDWRLVGFGDAGIKSLPDNLSSCGGQVVLLANEKEKKACILNWKSKKLVRKVASSLAGEALAMIAVMGSCIYFKALLKDMFGPKMKEVSIIVYTDSRNLARAVHTTSFVEDEWLIVDIAGAKDALEKGETQPHP